MGEEMVTLVVDAVEIEVPAGSSIMDACDLAGVYVPRLCAFPGLEPLGDCGLCFVQVDGGDARRACSVTVAPGMVVDTLDEQARGFRAGSMKAILGDHPHVCLTCPQRDGCDRIECMYGELVEARCCGEFGRCEIAKVAAFVGVLETAPVYAHRLLGGPVVDHTIRRDLDLCIGCGRCVAACDALEEAGSALELVETRTLAGAAGSGAATGDAAALEAVGEGAAASAAADWEPASYLGRHVAVPREADLASSGCTFCGACIMVCPTGALTADGGRGAAWLAKRRERTTLRAPVLPPVPPPEEGLAFTPENIATVPARAGVFRLFSAGGELLQVTGAIDMSAALREAAEGALGAEAHSFDFAEEPLYTQRESELLARHLQDRGSMPRGNDVLGGLIDDDDDAPFEENGVEPGLREQLLAEGWEERFSTAGGRLEETAEYYRSLGYDVRIEDAVEAAAAGSCTSCFTVPGAEGPVRVIFTRAGAAPLPAEEDLFE
ncbi:MAG: 2Fe-2S iron-sulfur cluster-binding protein [Thermoleophilia bacterium]